MKYLLSKLALAAILIFAASLASCDFPDTYKGEYVNVSGDAARDNNYAERGGLYRQNYFVTKIEAEDSSGASCPPLPLADTEYCFFTKKGSVLRVSASKTVWTRKLKDGEFAMSSCADPEQNFYFVTNFGRVISHAIDGDERFEIEPPVELGEYPEIGTILINDFGVYYSINNSVIKIDKNGENVKKIDFGSTVSKNFAATGDGDLAIPLTRHAFGATDTLAILSKNLDIKKRIPIENVRLVEEAAVSGDKIFLCGLQETSSKRFPVYLRIDLDGELKFMNRLPITPKHLSVDSDGDLYLVGYGAGIGESLGGVYRFSPDGTMKWKLFFKATLHSPAMLGEYYLAVLTSKENAVGLSYIDYEGTLRQTLTLSDAPAMLPKPVVAPKPSIVIGAAIESKIIRVEDMKFMGIF